MLWGDGSTDAQDSQRLKAFQQLATLGNAPPYVLGFEEPDCPSGSGSAGMTVADGVEKWESLIAPMQKKGALLGSPSMCSIILSFLLLYSTFIRGASEQADEDWLAEFRRQIETDWDFTAIHINKHTLAGVKKDIVIPFISNIFQYAFSGLQEHYMNYGKPIWVTEFACVNGGCKTFFFFFDCFLTLLSDVNGFVPCTDQKEINDFINEIVPYMEENPIIYAYAYSNGLGLGDVWPLMRGNSLRYAHLAIDDSFSTEDLGFMQRIWADVS